jgi:hypothetical protein
MFSLQRQWQNSMSLICLISVMFFLLRFEIIKQKQQVWSGLVCVVLHRALWAHVGDFGVALCRCALNHVSLFFFFSGTVPCGYRVP